MNADGQGFPRATKKGADLRHVQVIVEAKDKNLTVVVGELAHGPLELISIQGRGQSIQSQISRLLPLFEVRQRKVVMITPRVVHDDVGRNSIEPTTEGVIPELRPADVFERALERHRSEVLSDALVLNTAIDEAVDAGEVKVVELAESRTVLARSDHERSLVVGCHARGSITFHRATYGTDCGSMRQPATGTVWVGERTASV